jgi:hypothetical protein
MRWSHVMSCAIDACVLLDVSEIKMHLQFADSHFKIESQIETE